MKHFVIEIIYKAPIEKINETRPLHREFLQKAVKDGILLVSGPQVPKTGGIVITKHNSMEELAEYFKEDPYMKEDLAEYKYIEFEPRSHAEFMNDWIEK